MLKYLELADGSVTVLTSKGPTSVNANSFNYRPIIRGLKTSSLTEDEFFSLLSPSLPNGIYYAYELQDRLFTKHIDLEGKTTWDATGSDPFTTPKLEGSPAGAYASKADLINSFPEYFI